MVVYSPPFNREDDEAELRSLVAEARAGWLVTGSEDAVPSATYLPVLWRDGTVIAHFAKANSHWREIEDETPALLIVTGPDAYVTPTWYAAKAEHRKVVPTWNYSAVHLTNRSQADREGVVTGLRQSARPAERRVAEQMAAELHNG